ncbi:MAG: reverse transcriptase domain-containing protein, partial [Dehalococcoidia bacterium]|nr:reverse transcriptase domain-containing protein [Dehalococcoidia bacterium]
MEDWKYGHTLSGTPQGGVVSPILSNIYLDRLDKFVENVLTPAHTRGEARRRNPAYGRLSGQAWYQRQQGHHEQALKLRKQMQQLPSGDPYDPGYRRLRYLRYADDFVLGFIGPKVEAERIKESIGAFLRETLKLELSEEKTLITHATSQAAKFLGYELVNQQANDKFERRGRRSVNGCIGLRVPAKVIEQHCRAYMRNDKPAHRSEMLADDDYTIVSRYQAEFRGVIQYYKLAQNVSFFGRLQWVMQQSLAKTLANKHKTRRRKLIRRYMSTVQTEHGKRACLQVVVQRGNGKRPLVARFGGIPLKRDRQAVLVDQKPQRYRSDRNELIKRLLADECEMCGSTEDIQVHHVRALRDLNVKGQGEKPKWIQIMAARRRKTLVVCRPCHLIAHGGTW